MIKKDNPRTIQYIGHGKQLAAISNNITKLYIYKQLARPSLQGAVTLVRVKLKVEPYRNVCKKKFALVN